MPVASPTRLSTATTSYRSSLTSSTLDKPYYRSTGTYTSTTLRNSYGDTTTEYRSRYSVEDGKRERKTSLVEYSRSSRAPSVTDSDSGISTRYRSERSESRSRDMSSTRSESGKEPRVKRTLPTSAALAMSAAELYDKYSPNNYVPLTQRLQQQANNYSQIARSKSISNDIGRPPVADKLRKARNSAATIAEKPEGRRYKEISPSYGKRSSMSNGNKDSNGNEVPSVSEIRKRFDPKMTVTKLPANDTNRYTKSTVEQYLNQLKDSDNGIVGYTKLAKDEKPVPVHLPYVDKNGISKWDVGSSSRSNSNSDLSISKTLSEPVSLAKPLVEKNTSMTSSLTSKLPSERLASIKSQLDPNNPIGKILEKSTVITVENGDLDYKKLRNSPEVKLRHSPEVKLRNSPEVKLRNSTEVKLKNSPEFVRRSSETKSKEALKNEIEKQVKTPKHTSNFASYIQISQPIATGTSTPKSKDNNTNEEIITNGKSEPRKSKISLKYIDAEQEDKAVLNDNEIESPSGTGFENKTFEHDNYLKQRTEKEEGMRSMETSTESSSSEPAEDGGASPDTPAARRRLLDRREGDPPPRELAGGRSGPSGLRRSSERDSIPETREKTSSQTSGLNGLRNIGNTCFMNSVIQCLSNTRPLLEYLVTDSHAAEINTTLSCMRGALIGAFASVIKELWRTGEHDSVVNTTALKSQVQRFAPRFMGYSQQDAQEFLRYLLEGLHEDVNRVTVKPKPILTEIDDTLTDTAKAAEAWQRYLRMEESRVGDIFVGQLKSTLRCTHCNHDSVTFDPFWDLSLPIPSRTGNLKIQQCLQHFTKEEEMDGDEKPTCSKCGVRRKCLKWFTVQKFPQVLVLHLKRFSPTERFRGKLNVLVEFPLTGLDMAPYAATRGNQAMYNLYAVSNHSGTTYSGHYTAYCKHPYSGEWHEYNDSRVSSIKPRDVVSPEAYVLFYELAGGAPNHS